MSAAAIIQALWPAARRIMKLLGRWVIRRVRRHSAGWVAKRMEKRALGYQTRRMNAAKRKGDGWGAFVRFRKRQIARWLRAVAWLRANAKQLNGLAATELDNLARKAGIPLTRPNEGRV